MIIDHYKRLGYSVVTKDKPFLVITVKHAYLANILPIGDQLTGIRVNRVGTEYYKRMYLPVDVKGDTYRFAMDNMFFNGLGGRYEYEFVYKGNVVGKKQFVYYKPEVVFLGEGNV